MELTVENPAFFPQSSTVISYANDWSEYFSTLKKNKFTVENSDM